MRSPKSILLERLWSRDDPNQERIDLHHSAWEAEAAAIAQTEPYEGQQLVLFRQAEYLSDGDVQRVIIAAIQVINESVPDLASCVEDRLVSALATLCGCNRNPAYWRDIVAEHTLSELMTKTFIRNITDYDAMMERHVRDNA